MDDPTTIGDVEANKEEEERSKRMNKKKTLIDNLRQSAWIELRDSLVTKKTQGKKAVHLVRSKEEDESQSRPKRKKKSTNSIYPEKKRTIEQPTMETIETSAPINFSPPTANQLTDFSTLYPNSDNPMTEIVQTTRGTFQYKKVTVTAEVLFDCVLDLNQIYSELPKKSKTFANQEFGVQMIRGKPNKNGTVKEYLIISNVVNTSVKITLFANGRGRIKGNNCS